MASSVVIVVFLLTVSLCLLQVEGNCETKGKGKLRSFADERAYLNVPCKYHATTVNCGDYRIHVAPGLAFDSKYRLYTKTVWISIEKGEFYWRGRTSVKIVKNYLQTGFEPEPFKVKYENMEGAPFTIEWSADINDHSARIGVVDAPFQITFKSYDPKSKSVRKANGVNIVCTDKTDMEKTPYPASLCGNDTNAVLRARKRELGLKSKSKTLMYDMLDNEDVVQTNPQCEVAVDVFRNCQADRSEVIEACADAVMSNSIIKCLNKNTDNPMDVFVNCLKYKCNNDATSCDAMTAAMTGCPNLDAVPDSCPTE